MRRPLFLLAAIAASFALAGCGTEFGDNFARDAGRVAAGISGKEPPKPLYEQLTEADVAQAARTMQTALEKQADQEGLTWTSKDTGATGKITPVRTYQTDKGIYCRDYVEQITLRGVTERYDNYACRIGPGRWQWLE